VSVPKLEELVMYGNPLHSKIVEDGDLQWPLAVLKILPNLKKLDGISTIEWKVKISEGATPLTLEPSPTAPASLTVRWGGQGTRSS
jgi:hypothetical protein